MIMNKAIYLVFLYILFSSCKSTQVSRNNALTSVKIDTILKDKISIRPIIVSSDKVWYAADKNRVGFVNLANTDKKNLKFIKIL